MSDLELRIRRALPGDSDRLSQIARAAKGHWGYPEAWLTAWEPVLRIKPEYVERDPSSGTLAETRSGTEFARRKAARRAMLRPA